MSIHEDLNKSIAALDDLVKGKDGSLKEEETAKEQGKEGKEVEEGKQGEKAKKGKYDKGNKTEKSVDDTQQLSKSVVAQDGATGTNLAKSLNDYNPANPVAVAIRQIGIDAVVRAAKDSGHSDIQSYLAAFEPKQDATQVQPGAGEGTPASQVEGEIDKKQAIEGTFSGGRSDYNHM